MDELEKGELTQTRSLVPSSPKMELAHEVVEVSPEEVPHLLDYWQVILKHRWIVLSSLLIVFATVAIGTLKQKPLYEGKILIEVNPEEPSVLNFKEILQVSSADIYSYRETQYRIMESRTLASRVVHDLQLYRNPEFYMSSFFFGLFDTGPKTIPDASDPRPPDPSSDAYVNSVRNFLRALDVSPVRRSNLVEVSFLSRDPQVAARVANQLAATYIDQNLQVKWDETVKASDWLSTQLVGLKGKLEKSEDSLQAYAQANAILFVEEKKNLANARLEELQQEFTKAQADRFQAESRNALVQEGKVQDLPGFLSNRLIQDLAVRLSELEREYAQLTAVVKPDYPKAIQVKMQIDSVQTTLERQKRALAQNLVEEYQSALAREKYLAAALERQKAEVNDIAQKSIQYNILKREVDTNKQLYDGLLTRLKEAQVSAGLKASNVRVVDPAEVPKSPVRPRVLLNLALGLVFGLALGVGGAFFREYLDNTLKNSDDVERLLRLPSLGILPAFLAHAGEDKEETNKIVPIAAFDQEPVSAPAIQTDYAGVEAFRSLRTSILLSASPVPKMILVTSALPGEGKTTVTVNLGATLASLGSRVVVVDCDMRRPAAHRSAGVENNPGFVQCLTGHIDIVQAMLPVPGVANLSIIPCGPIPPNPAEILSSPAAGQLLQRLRSEFDYVLVDSPPLLSVADSRILATMTDAVVMVVRADSTPYDVVRRARALLYSAGARILGVALNCVDFRRDGYGSNYHYRYGAEYGYGHGKESSDKQEDQRQDL
jgi:polysaccharide biosynthesis transport protein